MATQGLGLGANRSTLDRYFDMLNIYVVNPLTSIVTHRIALPLLNRTYSFLGNSAVKIVRKVDPPTADKIEAGLKDPFSTETLLKAGDYFQNASLEWGKRSPITYSGAHYPDLCTIVAARHVYIFASDAKVILKAPASLRTLANEICAAVDEEIVQPLAPGGIKPKEPALRNRTPFLENWELQQGAQGSQAAPRAQGGQAVITLNTLRQKAHDLINAREKEVRQKIVGEAVHSVCKTVISSTARIVITAGVAYVCYNIAGTTGLLLTPVLSQMTDTASAGLMSVGACLFLRCSKTVTNFYNGQAIDMRASTLREYALCVGQENISSIIESVKMRFKPLASQDSLDKFGKRVEGLHIEMTFENGAQPFTQTLPV